MLVHFRTDLEPILIYYKKYKILSVIFAEEGFGNWQNYYELKLTLTFMKIKSFSYIGRFFPYISKVALIFHEGMK